MNWLDIRSINVNANDSIYVYACCDGGVTVIVAPFVRILLQTHFDKLFISGFYEYYSYSTGMDAVKYFIFQFLFLFFFVLLRTVAVTGLLRFISIVSNYYHQLVILLPVHHTPEVLVVERKCWWRLFLIYLEMASLHI